MRWSIVFIHLFCGLLLARQNPWQDHYFASNQEPSSDTLIVKELLERSKDHTFSNPEKAKGYAQKAITIAREAGDKKGEIEGLFQLGSIHIRQGDLDAAKPNFESGLKKSQEINSRTLVAKGFYHFSRFYEGKNNFGDAINFLYQALKLYEALGSQKNMARCYDSFGRIYQQTGNYTEALNNYFRALKINESRDWKRGISVVKTNIGNVYLNIKKFNDAINFFSEALLIDQSNDDKEGIFLNTLNIGVANQKMGLYEEALRNYRKALAIARELNYREDVAVLLGNIGSTLRQQGKLKQGLDSLFSSLRITNENNYDKAHNLNDISETYRALHDNTQAINYANQAVNASKSSQDINQLSYAYLNLSGAYEKKEDYQHAYKALELYNSSRDSLFSLEKERSTEELQIKYETEKKEQEIALLTMEKKTAEFRRNSYLISGLLITFILLLLYMNQRIKNKKNLQLLEKEQEITGMKSNFFSNISHEFRTPLTLISGPIEIMKSGIDDVKIIKQLNIMERNAARLLSLINQLLDLSKLESGKIKLSPAQVDMVRVVKGVTMTFQSLAEMKQIGLTIETKMDFLQLEVDREKVETIMINLINNAFTYTPEGGESPYLWEWVKTMRDMRFVALRSGIPAKVFSRKSYRMFSTVFIVELIRETTGKEGQVSGWRSPKSLLNYTMGP